MNPFFKHRDEVEEIRMKNASLRAELSSNEERMKNLFQQCDHTDEQGAESMHEFSELGSGKRYQTCKICGHTRKKRTTS